MARGLHVRHYEVVRWMRHPRFDCVSFLSPARTLVVEQAHARTPLLFTLLLLRNHQR